MNSIGFGAYDGFHSLHFAGTPRINPAAFGQLDGLTTKQYLMGAVGLGVAALVLSSRLRELLVGLVDSNKATRMRKERELWEAVRRAE